MQIRITDTAAVQSAIDTVAGRATAFIPSVIDLQEAAQRAENKLTGKDLSKARRVGAQLRFIPAGPSSHSYRHAAKTVRVIMTRKTSGWVITDVAEDRVYPKNKERNDLFVSVAQARLIRDAAVSDVIEMIEKPKRSAS